MAKTDDEANLNMAKPARIYHEAQSKYSPKPDFSKPRTEPLECMLVGMSRTGTQSMKEAFRILGYGTIYESLELIRRHHAHFARAALDAKYEDKGRRFALEQFESLFGEYRVISGEVVAPHAEELIDLYPDAKVILTVREDEEAWLRSIVNTMWFNYTNWASRTLNMLDPMMAEVRVYTEGFWKHVYWNNPEYHGIRVKREHEAMVIRKTAPERLLIYDVNEGWEPLCQFLGKDIPDEPFPHRNATKDHRAMFVSFRKRAFKGVLTKLMKRVGTIGVIFALAVWLRSRLSLLKR